jgi:NTP pyrophosphatase (non-canonical NTP hydrolase)
MTDLNELQNLALEMAIARGFDKDSLKDKVLVLAEEFGELASAILRGKGVIAKELVDCLAVILMMAFLAGMNGEESDKLRV